MSEEKTFVSRGGLKLDHALSVFGIVVVGRVCCDLGCSTGGFTDVLLRRGAKRVYAVDTGYGVLDWTLRNDERVVVMERTNAMHIVLPERVSLCVIDAGWTRQAKLLPHVRTLLVDGGGGGEVVTLIKPHYEVEADLLRKTQGVLDAERLPEVLADVRRDAAAAGFEWLNETVSPIRGSRGKNAKGNVEVLAHLRLTDAPATDGA